MLEAYLLEMVKTGLKVIYFPEDQSELHNSAAMLGLEAPSGADPRKKLRLRIGITVPAAESAVKKGDNELFRRIREVKLTKDFEKAVLLKRKYLDYFNREVHNIAKTLQLDMDDVHPPY